MSPASSEIRAEIMSIVAEVANMDQSDINPAASFAEDLGIDELMQMDIVMTLQRKLKVQSPESELLKADTIDKLTALIAQKLS